MIDPRELLAVARLLVTPSPPPTQGQLRRATSTAYYAVFHAVLRHAAERFFGNPTSGGYTILYRSFDHAPMKVACERLQRPTLSDQTKALLRRDAVSQDVRDFASGFGVLQEARHVADYDPTVRFDADDATAFIAIAETAIQNFDDISPDERADILALLMVRARP